MAIAPNNTISLAYHILPMKEVLLLVTTVSTVHVFVYIPYTLIIINQYYLYNYNG